jgi:2-oxoisovalerate dehydrogenase E1 component
MHFDKKNLSRKQLVLLYKNLLLPRMIEEKMLVMLRQGIISKWFSGIGQEAISAGAALALEEDEWILPLHRNLAVFTARKMPLHRLFKQWQGSAEGYSKGRERSFHFGSSEHHICGMISHLGPQLAVADGIALAHKLRKENKVTLVFTGEGGTSQGDFHEAVNLAAVWDLPVIFLIENNGYALSTPVKEQYRCESLVQKAAGYGIEGTSIDGNNILQVFNTVKNVRELCISRQKPYIIECVTFRMRGHEESSGVKYVPGELLEEWQYKDPIKTYEQYLLIEGHLTDKEKNSTRKVFERYIEAELKKGMHAPEVVPVTNRELYDVYAPEKNTIVKSRASGFSLPITRDIRFIDAIREALHQSMKVHDNLLLLGQDIAEYGGAFKITDGFVAEFGKTRVRNTPLCESAVLGAALGLSLQGFKSMVEMQFADFVTMGFNQITNNLAKIHYRWGQPADVVIRMPTGGGLGAGPFHSQSNEAWFIHTPGLKVVYPSSPADAKGLLIAAINDPNPVLFFEHKFLYRSIGGPVSSAYEETEIGKARIVQEGRDVSIITYGLGVHWACEYAQNNPALSIDILDLRTLLPLDHDAIRDSVTRTGKVLLLHEDVLTGGIGGEIAAWIGEHCFELLDAPVMRCASLDTPVPFNTVLEMNFLAKSRLEEYVERLISY